MGPEIAALAAAGAGALVGAMVTDVWGQAKESFLALWRRHRPESEEMVDAALESMREQVCAATDPDARATAARAAEGRLQGRIEALLEDHPAALADLRELLAASGGAAPRNVAGVVQEVHSGRDTYTAGRDQTIHQASRD